MDSDVQRRHVIDDHYQKLGWEANLRADQGTGHGGHSERRDE